MTLRNYRGQSSSGAEGRLRETPCARMVAAPIPTYEIPLSVILHLWRPVSRRCGRLHDSALIAVQQRGQTSYLLGDQQVDASTPIWSHWPFVYFVDWMPTA
jgi:hypothetical protein